MYSVASVQCDLGDQCGGHHDPVHQLLHTDLHPQTCPADLACAPEEGWVTL